MIGYVTIGSNNLDRSVAFYDAVLAEIGARRISEMDRLKMYGTAAGGPMLGVCRPYDGKAAEPGNGTMVAIEAKDPDQVQRLYDIALANRGSDEGAPGPRGEPDENGNTFYAAYFRDPDGNKLNAFCMINDG